MPRLVAELSWKRVCALGEGTHHVGGAKGLCVQKNGQATSWILCFTFAGHAREMGLGSLQEITLAEARTAAIDARKLLQAGIDPLEAKHQQRHDALAAARRRITFTEAAKSYIAAHGPGWRNPKHRQQWANTLARYAEPILGKLYAHQIDTPHVIKCLEPIWTSKTTTATRVRQRVEAVLDYCTARGFRKGDNPRAGPRTWTTCCRSRARWRR